MRVLWISAIIVLVDQAAKSAVLSFMYRHQSIDLLGDWLKLTFTENPGMAFGITFGPPWLITVLSIIATGLVIYYIIYVIWQARGAYLPYRVGLSLILGGAIGNVIDRVFYGELLGYGEFFTGKVVDFIHVSLWEGFIPEVVPLVGGAYMELFPIWNVADMAIVVGVVGVLFFHHGFHMQMEERRRAAEESDEADASPGAPSPAAHASALPDTESSNGLSSPPSPSSMSDRPEDASPPEMPIVEDTESSSEDGGDEDEPRSERS